jgi:hypothetical protein
MRTKGGSRTIRAAFLLAAVGSLTACGGGGGSPVSPSPTTTVSFLEAFAVTGLGTYSATLNGQTYTAQGGFSIGLPPGTYELSGSYTGGTMIVGFASAPLSQGGVQSGSVQSLAGSILAVTSCGATYSEGTGTQAFRLRFTVGTNPNSACQ